RIVLCSSSIFFFQAEDGIRDFHVTGVQTCALPIWGGSPTAAIRTEMQRTMQAHCAVFRTDKVLAEGIDKLAAIYQRMQDISVTEIGRASVGKESRPRWSLENGQSKG